MHTKLIQKMYINMTKYINDKVINYKIPKIICKITKSRTNIKNKTNNKCKINH